MKIEAASLKELQNIYYKHFGIMLSERQALDLGTGLIETFKVIARPLPIDYTERKGKNVKQNG